MKTSRLFLIFILGIFNLTLVYAAEPVLITLSSSLDIIFDGKWSHDLEWKPTSWNQYNYDDGFQIHLRTAHQEDFIYIQVDPISDTIMNKLADRAIVCFDGNNDKSSLPDENDYCFVAVFDGKKPFAYNDKSLIVLNGNFKQISSPQGLIAIGSVSNEHDRYSKVPHASYEFRIPIDVIGRSDNYGFYFSVFDAHRNNVYSYPQDVILEKPFQIPSPKHWGELVSPDKSIS